ncbi:MAG: radical SAM protein [Theionarchaea archaeon]|nr:radical SAM protein [Theionarchaea archaeon]
MKSGKEYKIIDPFYTGEWIVDEDFIACYLACLHHAFDREKLYAYGYGKSELDDFFNTIEEKGISKKCDFDARVVLNRLPNAPDGIITPPVPIFEILTECNYRCPWCYLPPDAAPSRKESPLTLEQIRNHVVQPLVQIGCNYWTLTGGEPSLNMQRLTDVCRIIHEESSGVVSDEKIMLLTNGSHLKNLALTYRDLGIFHVQVSMSSPDHKKDGALRKAPKTLDSVEEIRRGVIEAVNQGIVISFNVVLVPDRDGLFTNMYEIPEIATFADEIGVRMVRFVPVVYSGKARVNEWALTLDQLKEARIQIKKAADSVKDTIIYSPIGYDVPPEKPVYCRAGNEVLYIDTGGFAYPCNNLIVQDMLCSEHSTKTMPLDDIWFHSELLNELRISKDVCVECLNCDIRTECGGQCRAVCWLRYGQIDLNSKPITCLRDQSSSH